MPAYKKVSFEKIDRQQSETLIALLSENGFDGFEEMEDSLHAYIPEEKYSSETVNEICGSAGISFTISTLADTNWNAVWESNFEPVVVDDFVGIRADFHAPLTGVLHELVITPKMSFGTGHHATTHMMIQQMSKIDFAGKTVFDFGTGTGILAILATRLGAKQVVAIDIDDWSINNAKENADRNGTAGVELRQMNTASVQQEFDIILANINKNVILENFETLQRQMDKGGILLLSGLLQEDEKEINEAAKRLSLEQGGVYTRDKWICIPYHRQQEF